MAFRGCQRAEEETRAIVVGLGERGLSLGIFRH